MNVDVLEKISSDNSRAFKETWIAKLDEDCKRFVKLALDPDVTFGITIDENDAQIFRAIKPISEREYVAELTEFLEKARNRVITGNIAEGQMWKVVQAAPTPLHAKWTARIINRNLRAGFDIKTYNRVFQDEVIAKFAVQLADMYGDYDLEGLWYFQPKLDGNRVVFIDGRARSRSGKYYPNCEFVVEEIEKRYGPEFWDKWVIDGEMMGDLGFDQSSGALRRISQKGRKKATFTYWAFDLINRADWEARKSQELTLRDESLRHVLAGFDRIKLVPQQAIYNPTHRQIMDICKEYVAAGFEGAMAKRADSAYEWKRGHNILKVKLFKEMDCRIAPESFYEGNGKNKGMLGGLYIIGEDGIKSKCGGGFSDALRREIWNNKKDWENAIIQVQYFEKTKDGSLRFPVFIMRRKDKEGQSVASQVPPEVMEARKRAAKRMVAEVMASGAKLVPPSGSVVKGQPKRELPDELPEDL